MTAYGRAPRVKLGTIAAVHVAIFPSYDTARSRLGAPSVLVNPDGRNQRTYDELFECYKKMRALVEESGTIAVWKRHRYRYMGR